MWPGTARLPACGGAFPPPHNTRHRPARRPRTLAAAPRAAAQRAPPQLDFALLAALVFAENAVQVIPAAVRITPFNRLDSCFTPATHRSSFALHRLCAGSRRSGPAPAARRRRIALTAQSIYPSHLSESVSRSQKSRPPGRRARSSAPSRKAP